MKRWIPIAFALCIVVFSACSRAVETRHGTSLPPSVSPELQAVDSLMWQRPDSALMMIVDYFARRDALNASPNDASSYVSPQNGINDSIPRRKHCVSTAYDDHYAHLLLAELLYKNDYAQTNREELRQAVAYFDSLVWQAPPLPPCKGGWGIKRGPGGLKHTLPNPNDILFFLVARAHYINGVGYYERDSVVEACKEYLKALETMEGYFKEKELVGKKARFMTLTYNRFIDLFSSHFMQEPAIICAKYSLYYDKIEPNSPYNRANTLYRIALQYDKLKETDSAAFYYFAAMNAFPDRNALVYRDLIASHALFLYNTRHETIIALDSLKKIAKLSVSETERLGRFFTIGFVYYSEKQYDSALVYLSPVYEKESANMAMAAECLREIALNEGDYLKADMYAHVLVGNTNLSAEHSATVSQVDDLFNRFMDIKRKKENDQARHKAILRTGTIVVIIAVLIISIVILFLKRYNKKRFKKLHSEHKQLIETLEIEKKSHQTKQSILAVQLKQKKLELSELKDQINRQSKSADIINHAKMFAEEPICQLIMERVNKGSFKSKIDSTYYKDYALDKGQMLALQIAVDHHFNQLTSRLKKTYPELTKTDIDYCCLYLLGLTDADVAALMQRAYNTVSERSNRLRKIFGSKNRVSVTLRSIADNNATS